MPNNTEIIRTADGRIVARKRLPGRSSPPGDRRIVTREDAQYQKRKAYRAAIIPASVGYAKNPQQYYSILEKDDLNNVNNVQYFTSTPDANEILGNYRKPFIEQIAHITGIKFDIAPETQENTDADDAVFDAINTMLSSTIKLIVNKYPVFSWKGDDIGPIPQIAVTQDDTNIFTMVTAHAPAFTTFRDLIEINQIATKEIDNIYVDQRFLAANAAIPTGFEAKATLLIRPDQRIPIGASPVGRVPGYRGPLFRGEGDIGTEEEYYLEHGVEAGFTPMFKTPMALYHVLTETDALTTYDGQTIEFFRLRPDANELYGNFGEENIHKTMSIQGLKLGFYPYINYADKDGTYPIGEYLYMINLFKQGTFELVVNNNPVFSWKGAELLGDLQIGATVLNPGTGTTWYVTAKKQEKYLIFKDLVAAKKLDVTDHDDVWIRCRLPSIAVDAAWPSDFHVKLTMLVAAVPKPIRM
jgi:hypothetical protein